MVTLYAISSVGRISNIVPYMVNDNLLLEISELIF
jgi:hypothetical protein